MYARRYRAFLVVCGVSVAMLASASNLNFLKNAPVSYFNDHDVEMMMQAADAALNDERAHASREWKNPESGNSGKVEVLRAFKGSKGTACKRLQVSNRAHNGIEGSAVYSVCKDKDAWMLADEKPRD